MEYNKATRPEVKDLASRYVGAARASVLKADAAARQLWGTYEQAQDALAEHLSNPPTCATDIAVAVQLSNEANHLAKRIETELPVRWRAGTTRGICFNCDNDNKYHSTMYSGLSIRYAAGKMCAEAQGAGVNIPSICLCPEWEELGPWLEAAIKAGI